MDRIKADFFRTTLLNERRLGCRQTLTFLDLPFPADHTADAGDPNWAAKLTDYDPAAKTLVFLPGDRLEALLPELERLLQPGSALAFDWPYPGNSREPGQQQIQGARFGFRLYEQRDLYDTLLWYQQMKARMPHGPRRRTLCLAVRR